MEMEEPQISDIMSEYTARRFSVAPSEAAEISTIGCLSSFIIRDKDSDEETASTEIVPPATPASIFSFEHNFHPVPKQLLKLDDNFKVPYVRELGIKSCIEILGDYFQCKDYKFNSIQFWFLDVITDCLWRMQDEFQFPEHYQKIIIEWILYAFDLIRDGERNLSKKQFFKIIAEALMITEERVQGGCDLLPSPADLFILVQEEKDEILSLSEMTTEENSTLSIVSEESKEQSYLAIEMDENVDLFQLPKPPCMCFEYLYSSESSEVEEENEEESFDYSDESIEFYQPDPRTPDRFRSSSSSTPLVDNAISFICKDYERVLDEEQFSAEGFAWNVSSEHSNLSRRSCPREIPTIEENPASVISEHISEWGKLIQKHDAPIKQVERNAYINSCALNAIKNFIFDYFEESFQFLLTKLCFSNIHGVISQKTNSTWNVPKVLREQLKTPKPKKPKKEKKPKKAPKKKDKKKSKKDKKSKGSKKSKKDKKPKKQKLTKAEKAELARLKKEQARLEEEMRKAEENRRLLFPLNDAATDDFFKEIFEHWVKPKAKKDKKSKKGKKGR